VAVVPAPGSSIFGMVVLPPSARGDPWLEAYAHTSTGIFHIAAKDPTRWVSTRVNIPAGTVVSSFRDGTRVRVGFSDGTVETLPSLVPLAPPLPENPPIATAFAQVCGQGYALGAQALYRMVPDVDGGAVTGTGHWEVQPLSAPIVSANGDPGFQGGMLQSFGSHLYVGTVYGTVMRLDVPQPCPPGLGR
jgi:hypothetical protein